MASGGKKRKRSDRVAALELPPNQWERVLTSVRRPDVLVRVGLAIATAVLLCFVIRVWDLPFPYRSGFRPTADLTARVAFHVDNPAETRALQDRARWQVPFVFVRDREPLNRLEETLRNTVLELLAAPSYDELPHPDAWRDFMPSTPDRTPSDKELREGFDLFRKTLAGDEDLKRFTSAVSEALEEYDSTGLLRSLAQKKQAEERLGEGNRDRIVVRQSEQDPRGTVVSIGDVLIGNATLLRQRLEHKLGEKELSGVTERVFAWLHVNLPDTLILDEEGTEVALDEAAASVQPATIEYEPGDRVVAAGTVIDAELLTLLSTEHQAANRARTVYQKASRVLAAFTLFGAVLALWAIYFVGHQRTLLGNLRQLSMVAALLAIAVGTASWASGDAWRAELIPVLLFGQVLAIAFDRQLALLGAGTAALVIVLGTGQGIGSLCILWGVTAAAVLQLASIRSRSKLIYVGMFAAIVAFLLTLVVGCLASQPFSLDLLALAGRNALWTAAVGFVMQGLLPFVERLFGVLTDMSLLHLGDVSHPLLQELVRRAPSTYNHSITVGAMAEAAADAIGARGLLARVGAYFHDIGKMLKPNYFIENQPPNENRHESLVPQMSTLVIVAHIKDGADLARQHKLPGPIIDFIEQHHGTTLVEYFYGRASEQKQNDPDGGEVEESSFRYPGPKPQTKETAVLMLADASESACRSLVEPGPARIESLVREIAERKLEDGQFDESGLTLRELRTVEDSMIKSLIANYHGRIKYPDQKPA